MTTQKITYLALLRGINVGGNNVVMLPVYKQMTIRNWNTTTKLLELMKV